MAHFFYKNGKTNSLSASRLEKRQTLKREKISTF